MVTAHIFILNITACYYFLTTCYFGCYCITLFHYYEACYYVIAAYYYVVIGSHYYALAITIIHQNIREVFASCTGRKMPIKDAAQLL